MLYEKTYNEICLLTADIYFRFHPRDLHGIKDYVVVGKRKFCFSEAPHVRNINMSFIKSISFVRTFFLELKIVFLLAKFAKIYSFETHSAKICKCVGLVRIAAFPGFP